MSLWCGGRERSQRRSLGTGAKSRINPRPERRERLPKAPVLIYGLCLQTVLQTVPHTVVKIVQTVQTAIANPMRLISMFGVCVGYGLCVQTGLQTVIQTVVKIVQTIQTV